MPYAKLGRHPDMQHEARTLTLRNGAHRDRNGAGDGPPFISSGATERGASRSPMTARGPFLWSPPVLLLSCADLQKGAQDEQQRRILRLAS